MTPALAQANSQANSQWNANIAPEPQIVIVGGGIAGAALATALARAGRQVLVLESTDVFRDRVRGESMMPWGVAEAQCLGLMDLLRAAGAHTAPLWKRYSEGDAVPRDLPVGRFIPGVGGSLNLHHPIACQALLDAAAAAGASVIRGVRKVSVVPGVNPTVCFELAGIVKTVAPSLVVGADGRGSVVRRCAGIELQQQEASAYVAGLLLEGVAGSDGHDTVMEHELGVCLLIRQTGARARAYHIVPTEHRTRYAGDGGAQRFLADATGPGSPLSAVLADAQPIGPCGAVPGTDTWTDRPYAEGMVLIGDAAGHNSPSVGCGHSRSRQPAQRTPKALRPGHGDHGQKYLPNHVRHVCRPRDHPRPSRQRRRVGPHPCRLINIGNDLLRVRAK